MPNSMTNVGVPATATWTVSVSFQCVPRLPVHFCASNQGYVMKGANQQNNKPLDGAGGGGHVSHSAMLTPSPGVRPRCGAPLSRPWSRRLWVGHGAVDVACAGGAASRWPRPSAAPKPLCIPLLPPLLCALSCRRQLKDCQGSATNLLLLPPRAIAGPWKLTMLFISAENISRGFTQS